MSYLIPRRPFTKADEVYCRTGRIVKRQPRELTSQQCRVQQRLETKVNSICTMYKDGMSLRQIAAIHRTSHETIRQILNNHGILTQYRYKQKERTIGQKRTDSSGYVHIFVGKSSPGATKIGWILEHRLILQEHLGRPLLPWEVVHHRDRDKANNSLANLEVTSITGHATCINCPYYAYYRQATGNSKIKPEDLTKS